MTNAIKSIKAGVLGFSYEKRPHQPKEMFLSESIFFNFKLDVITSIVDRALYIKQ